MIKRIILTILFTFLLLGSLHAAECLKVESAGWSVESYVTLELVITNNCNKNLDYSEMNVIAYNKGKMVGACSRPIQITSGGFITKDFWFKGTTEIDSYKCSFQRVKWK